MTVIVASVDWERTKTAMSNVTKLHNHLHTIVMLSPDHAGYTAQCGETHKRI